MSQLGAKQPSSVSEGTGLTFVRPLPQSRSAQFSERHAVPTSPREQLEFASRLFPPRGSEDSGSLPPVTGLELGHFVLEERIGRGGMGAVFRAIDQRLDRVVALKVLSPDLSSDPEAVQRFENEARSAARLDHDNIARVHYIGEENGLHFIAFEFVTGTNVRNFILQKGKLSPESAVNYTLQIAEALRHTAAANVVHRDIKPSNIIVSPTGRAKLVDLGLARHHATDQSHDLTVAGTALGTFDYIAPEQAIDARNVDVRSDIYSLGCTMYHMLTGEPPYPKGTMFQKVMNHHGPTPPDACLKNPRVSVQLSRVIQKMMAANPDERYANADALIHDLVQIGENLGLAPTYPEAVVWTTPLFKARNPYWDGSRTWMAVALVLLLLVYLVDRLQPNNASVTQSQPNEPDLGEPATDLSHSIASVEQEFSTNSRNSSEAPSAVVKPDGGTNNSSVTNPTVETSSKPLSNLGLTASTPQLGGNWPSDILSGDANRFWESLGNLNVETNRETPAVSATPMKPDRTPDMQASPISTVVPKPINDAPFLVTQTKTGESVNVATLSEAFVLAVDNSVIEVQNDITFTMQKEAIQFANKRVILRAANDSHPVIRFDLTEELALRPLASIASIIEIGRGGALEVYDLDLELIVDPQTTVDEWSIVKLSPGAEFTARWTSFTMNNPEQISAALVLIPASEPADISNLMPERMSGRPSKVQIRDSICRGQMDFVKQLDLHPLDVNIEETALAISGTIHRLDGSNSVETNMSTPAEPSTVMILNHVTALVGEGLLTATTGDHGTLEPVTIDIRDSVFRVEREKQALLKLSGHLDSDLLRNKVEWRAHSDISFVETSGPIFTVESSASFQFEPQVVSQREIGETFEQVLAGQLFQMPGPVSLSALHTIQPAAFTLREVETESNPAFKAASDGRNAGVDWTRSGLPQSLPLPRTGPFLGDTLESPY